MVVAYLPQTELEGDHPYLEPAIPPFAGRLGGNQDFIVDRNDPKNVDVLEKVPDAAPCMTLAEIFDLRGFLSADLWKFAMLECIGKTSFLSRSVDERNFCSHATIPSSCVDIFIIMANNGLYSKLNERLHFVLGNDTPTVQDDFAADPGRRLRYCHLLLPTLRRYHQSPSDSAVDLYLLPLEWRSY